MWKRVVSSSTGIIYHYFNVAHVASSATARLNQLITSINELFLLATQWERARTSQLHHPYFAPPAPPLTTRYTDAQSNMTLLSPNEQCQNSSSRPFAAMQCTGICQSPINMANSSPTNVLQRNILRKSPISRMHVSPPQQQKDRYVKSMVYTIRTTPTNNLLDTLSLPPPAAKEDKHPSSLFYDENVTLCQGMIYSQLLTQEDACDILTSNVNSSDDDEDIRE